MLNHQLHRNPPLPFVAIQAVSEFRPFWQGVCVVEPDGIEALGAALQEQLQVFAFKQALVQHRKRVAKHGGGKAGTSYLFLQQARYFDGGKIGLQRAVGFNNGLEAFGARELPHGGIEPIDKT